MTHAPNLAVWASDAEPATGPLTRAVLAFEEAIKRGVSSAKRQPDWTELADLVALDEFERIGAWLEVMNWKQYVEMLTRWASATDGFETSLRRVSELPGRVYFEIEERHFRGDSADVVNSLTVFEFNPDGKIRHLDVYLQRRRDNGS
jgi:hypothetical protein